MGALPASTSATIRPDLAMVFNEFDEEIDRLGFIGPRLLPFLNVVLQSANFPKIKLESLLRNQNVDRNSQGGYSRGDYEWTTDSYATKERGTEQAVDDRIAKIMGRYWNQEAKATRLARDRILREQEKRIAALFFPGAYTPTAVSVEWSTIATAVPIDNVLASRRRVWAATGVWPNAFVCGMTAFQNLQRCAQVIDVISANGAGDRVKANDITKSMIAQVFGVKHVLVGGSAKNTADEGQARAIAEIWDDEYAMTCVIAESEDLEEPCVGRTFHYTDDGSEVDGTIEVYRDETVRADIVRARHDVDEKLLYTTMADVMSNITA